MCENIFSKGVYEKIDFLFFVILKNVVNQYQLFNKSHDPRIFAKMLKFKIAFNYSFDTYKKILHLIMPLKI